MEKIDYKFEIGDLVIVDDAKPSTEGLPQDEIDFINKLYDGDTQRTPLVFKIKGKGHIEYGDGVVRKFYDCWFEDTIDAVGSNIFEENELVIYVKQ